jgi:hypothetical protein
MCAAGNIFCETYFEFRRGIRLHDTERVEATLACLFGEGSLDRGWIAQKSRLA